MAEDEDIPTLSAESLAALAEFRREEAERIEKEERGAEHPHEDWQLSQFWYSEETARRLCEEVEKALPSGGRVALLSTPTLMPYFRQLKGFDEGLFFVRLFEFDRRFARTYSDEYVYFDYNQPTEVPPSLAGRFDLFVVDPPFLTGEVMAQYAEAVRHLARDRAKVIVCTGAVMENEVERLFNAKRCNFVPRHANNLSNDFASFANYDTVTL